MEVQKFRQMVLVTYMVKSLKILNSIIRRLMSLRFEHLGCGAYQACSYDGPRFTLTYLTSRSNFFEMHMHLNGKKLKI